VNGQEPVRSIEKEDVEHESGREQPEEEDRKEQRDSSDFDDTAVRVLESVGFVERGEGRFGIHFDEEEEADDLTEDAGDGGGVPSHVQEFQTDQQREDEDD
jgi:hypothetical protein